MTPDAILTRASVLIERADACAAGFRRLGKRFSADITDGMGRDVRTHPNLSPLFEHWIGEQEKRLAALNAVIKGE